MFQLGFRKVLRTIQIFLPILRHPLPLALRSSLAPSTLGLFGFIVQLLKNLLLGIILCHKLLKKLVSRRAVASVRLGGQISPPPHKFWTGSTAIDSELCFSVFVVIQNEKVFLFSVK